MRKSTPEIREGLLEVVRFCLVGAASAAVDAATLYALTEYAGIFYLTSSIAAFVASYAVSFWFQKRWTFRSRGMKNVGRQLCWHLSLQLFNLALNTAFLALLVEVLHLWYIAAQLITNVPIAAWTFIATRWIFTRLSPDGSLP